jgi:hypothetical protein
LALASAGLALGERREKSTIRREFAEPVARVDIEISNGALDLAFGETGPIRLEADVEWSGATPEDVALARQEVKLETKIDQGVLWVWVERTRERWTSRYGARHDLRVWLPGSLRVLARTSNGALRAAWRKQPGGSVYFRTHNGELELSFAAPPDADFKLRTRNGGVYSAFSMAPLPDEPEAAQVTNDGMRRIVSRTRYAGGRAGRGGPMIEAETSNGDIRVMERKA